MRTLITSLLCSLWLVAAVSCAHRPAASSPRITELDAKLRSDPADVEALIDRGYVFCLLGQRHPAAADFERALNLKPNDPLMHSRLGWAWFNYGDASRALRYWERAVELSEGKKYYDDYILAVGYVATDHPARAAAAYARAVQRDERFGDWEKLVKRVEPWTQKEKQAIYAAFDLWRKTHRGSGE